MKLHDIEYIEKSYKAIKTKEDFLFLLNFVKNIALPTDTLNFTHSELLHFSRNSHLEYYTFFIPKKKGGKRFIHAPFQRLKHLQKCINIILSVNFELSNFAFGYVRNKTIKDNAKLHIEQQYVFNADIKDFFPSITSEFLKKTLTNITQNDLAHLGKELIFNLIIDICCVKSKDRFVLSHGSPTSPILSNIVFKSIDFDLKYLASSYDLNYSRYADDITFSGRNNIFNQQGEFYQSFLAIINKNNFSINITKTRVQKFTKKQSVTGLTVNKKVNVPKAYIKDLRKWIHFLEIYKIDRTQYIYSTQYKSNKSILLVLDGKLNYLGRIKGVENETYIKLKNRFDNITQLNIQTPKDTHFKKKSLKSIFKPSSTANYFFNGEYLSHVESQLKEGQQEKWLEIKNKVRYFKKIWVNLPDKAVSLITWKEVTVQNRNTSVLKSDILLNRRPSNTIIVGEFKNTPIVTLQDNTNLFTILPSNLKWTGDKAEETESLNLIRENIANNQSLIDLVKSDKFTPALFDALSKTIGEVESKGEKKVSYLLRTTDTFESFKKNVTNQYEAYQKVKDDYSKIPSVFNIFPVSYGLSLPDEPTSTSVSEVEDELSFKFDGKVYAEITFTYNYGINGVKIPEFVGVDNKKLKDLLKSKFNNLSEKDKNAIISYYGIVTAAINPSGELTFGFKPLKIGTTTTDLLSKLALDESSFKIKEEIFFKDEGSDMITYIEKDGKFIPAKVIVNSKLNEKGEKIITLSLFKTVKKDQWVIPKNSVKVGFQAINVTKGFPTTFRFEFSKVDENNKTDHSVKVKTTNVQVVNHQKLRNPFKTIETSKEVSVFKLNKNKLVYDTHYIIMRVNEGFNEESL